MAGIAFVIHWGGREPARAALGLMLAAMTRPGEAAQRWPTDAGIRVEGGCIGRSPPDHRSAPGIASSGSASLLMHSQLLAADEVLAAYLERGAAAFKRLSGWFCGVLIDRCAREVVVFNDVYGLGRLYHHEAEEGHYFATEAKALLAARPELARLDPVATAEFLTCGAVLQNRTLFPSVSLLPGGACWRAAEHGGLSRDSHFDFSEWESQQTLLEAPFREEFRATFHQAMSVYFRRGLRAGMSLTGGLDGRMIMATIRPQEDELPCYTFASVYRDTADVAIARSVARVRHQSHSSIVVGDEFLRRFPVLAEACIKFSDGAMDVSGAAEIYANERAREIAPVRLTGNYGSEVLRRNVAFKPYAFATELLAPETRMQARDAARTYAGERRAHPLTFILSKQVPWHHFARLSVENAVLPVLSPYLDPAVAALMYRAPEQLTTRPDLALQYVQRECPALAEIPTDRGLQVGAQRFAVRVRRLHADVTARAEYAWDYGMPPWLCRIDRKLAWLRPERLFLGRHKFYHFRTWYRTRLAPYLQDVLLDAHSLQRPYLVGAAVARAVQEHVEGNRNYTVEFHRLLSLELVQRMFLESAANARYARYVPEVGVPC